MMPPVVTPEPYDMASGAKTAGVYAPSPRGRLLTTAFASLAIGALLVLIAVSAREELLAWDVRFAYLPAAEAVLDGESPYPKIDDPILEEQKGYVYPPQLVLALVPLTVLPADAVAVLFAIGMVALLGLTLYVLEIRDARCYAAAVLWVPAISGVLHSNVSIPLALALALVWRYRDAVWPPAVALGLSVSAKLLFWPMFVWMLATRRIRATVASIAIGLCVTLAAWAAIGFAGLLEYPDLLERLSEIQSERSYSFAGIASTLGLGEAAGVVLTLAGGGALLALCTVFARQKDDARSFTCAVAATLAFSPIVWLHYLVVLLVPLAILRPRFSLVWLLPMLLWVSPKPGYAEGLATLLPGIATAILLAVVLIRPSAGGVANARPRTA